MPMLSVWAVKPLPKLAMIDMDGVLYDSMKYHTLAWKRMTDEIGLDCTREEFLSL